MAPHPRVDAFDQNEALTVSCVQLRGNSGHGDDHRRDRGAERDDAIALAKPHVVYP